MLLCSVTAPISGFWKQCRPLITRRRNYVNFGPEQPMTLAPLYQTDPSNVTSSTELFSMCVNARLSTDILPCEERGLGLFYSSLLLLIGSFPFLSSSGKLAKDSFLRRKKTPILQLVLLVGCGVHGPTIVFGQAIMSTGTEFPSLVYL